MVKIKGKLPTHQIKVIKLEIKLVKHEFLSETNTHRRLFEVKLSK